MTTSDTIFDRALLQRRKDRAARQQAPGTGLQFLLERSVDDIAWRAGSIQRTFARSAVLGAYRGELSSRLRTLPNVGALVDLEACPALALACPGPVTVADEEALPLADGAFDLLASALSLHFVNDLPGVLAQARRALKPDGLLLVSLLGGETLHELRDALVSAEAELEGGASPRVAPFADVRALGGLLQRAELTLPVVDVDTVRVTYADPLALLRDLRASGATNCLAARRRTPLRRGTLLRALEVYADRFSTAGGRIRATFEIVTLTAWARHDSQQKPLAPGSAAMRLADALGVAEQSAGERSDPRSRA
jgi:SAM-dependent methyltransferase